MFTHKGEILVTGTSNQRGACINYQSAAAAAESNVFSINKNLTGFNRPVAFIYNWIIEDFSFDERLVDASQHQNGFLRGFVFIF